jgi:hypothetical protein
MPNGLVGDVGVMKSLGTLGGEALLLAEPARANMGCLINGLSSSFSLNARR